MWKASAQCGRVGKTEVWHCGSNFVLVYAIVHEVTNWDWRKLTKLSTTIFSKFWSRDRYPVCIHGFRPRCFTCIVKQVTSEVVDMFLGAGGPWPVISRTDARNGQICPFRFEDIILLTVDPDRVIYNHRNSSHVGSCQLTVCWVYFADSTSADHFDFNRLYPTTVNKVWCLQRGQIL